MKIQDMKKIKSKREVKIIHLPIKENTEPLKTREEIIPNKLESH
jgi:hypothetical protein